MKDAWFQGVVSGSERSVSGKLARGVLRLLSMGYGWAVKWRNWMFDARWREAERLPRPVVSVGNLTAGGTGKTPMVIHLAEHLRSLGATPAVLLRGYKAAGTAGGVSVGGTSLGGAARVGGGSDEALEIQAALGDASAVVADADRSRGARRALDQKPGTRVFLLDDGFQHRQTHRDLDLVLVDATRPFGYGYLLPRGFLREPAANLKRASAVIVTRADQVSAEVLADLDDRIADLSGQPPIAHVAHRWTGLVDHSGQVKQVGELRGQVVASAVGIGNPQAFFDMLRRSGAAVVWSRALADHHLPARGELMVMLERARAEGASALVTTEKDWVKWAKLLNDDKPLVPVLRPRLAIEILDGEAAIHALLRKTANRLG